MNFEEKEIIKNEKDDNNNNLILTTRIISIVALFEYIGILVYILIATFTLGSIGKLSTIWNGEDVTIIAKKILNSCIMLGLFIFLCYITFTIINHKMSIQKNKKLKNLLIIEIVLLIIFMSLPLISLLT